MILFNQYRAELRKVNRLESLSTENEYLQIQLQNLQESLRRQQEAKTAPPPQKKRSPHKAKLVRENEQMTTELSFVNYENEGLSNEVDAMTTKINSLQMEILYLKNEIVQKDKLLSNSDFGSTFLDQEKIIIGLNEELATITDQHTIVTHQLHQLQLEHNSLQSEYKDFTEQCLLTDLDHIFHQELLEAMIDGYRVEIKEMKEKK